MASWYAPSAPLDFAGGVSYAKRGRIPRGSDPGVVQDLAVRTIPGSLDICGLVAIHLQCRFGPSSFHVPFVVIPVVCTRIYFRFVWASSLRRVSGFITRGSSSGVSASSSINSS
jgi:hypothetical protein